MRCKACDLVLTDYEATRKFKTSGIYLDLCDNCFNPEEYTDVVVDRVDLLSKHVRDYEWVD